ncbi:hypothetical protein GOP47_0024412 [Adiantum capillus-veneris]|uniref:Peptidase A1 domain-containing protein n=1 Tax=Adiantum capillus-veneris TaxID=13818 RepID=A0A9D4Z4D1_ADICA|nr:hypothetical protein GOP47_0024412 [Adiantum capillus-veneris]
MAALIFNLILIVAVGLQAMPLISVAAQAQRALLHQYNPTQDEFSRNVGTVLTFVIHAAAAGDKLIRRTLQDRRPVTLPLVSGYELGNVNYYVRPVVGSTRRSFYMTMDTAADLTWLQCQPCHPCFEQLDQPIFDPRVDSTTLSDIRGRSPLCNLLGAASITSMPDSPTCTYLKVYQDGSMTAGKLVSDTLALPDILFGCSHRSRSEQEGGFQDMAGIMGLSRGPLAFPSQLRRRALPSTFSYCLPKMYSADSSTLTFGTGGSHIAHNTVFTPLIINPEHPFYYYVHLTGISIGSRFLDLPSGLFDIDPSTGDGGLQIDSGAAITRLHPLAYHALRDTMQAIIAAHAPQLLPGEPYIDLLDTCYFLADGVQHDHLLDGVPSVVLHFARAADLVLPPDIVLMSLDKPDPDSDEHHPVCLSFSSSDINANFLRATSVLGNIHQQRTRFIFDVDNDRMGLTANEC